MTDIKNKVYYPLNYEPRQGQIDALDFIKHNIRRGKKFIQLNLPTGSGKSYLSIMFINWYLNHINKDASFDMLTNNKVLQQQYVNEFNFINNLKGKNSYMCGSYPGSTCAEGKELNKALKVKCSNCPYDAAMSDWLSGRVNLTNFHLFDTLHLFVPSIFDAKKRNVLIIDESHNFESILCDFISMKITERNLKSLGFTDMKINNINRELYKVANVTDFLGFINNYFLIELDMLQTNLENRLSSTMIGQTEKIKISKQINSISTTFTTYNSFVTSIDDKTDSIDNWVLEKEFIKEDKNNKKKLLMTTNYSVQPIWSHKYLSDYIFKHYDHVIMMSGTILDRAVFSFLNGIDNTLSAYHEVSSSFPIKNRPIYYIKKCGKMTYTQKEETWKNQIPFIKKITNKYSEDKGIIHTSNYELARWMEEEFGDDDRFLFHTPETREEVLEEHLRSPKPTILVSPSMQEGIDLKDNLSRFQIILKIPFPHLGSAKNKARMNQYKDWYGWKTCCDFIQSLGRSVRSEDDWANTFILDATFSNVLQYNYKFIPKYILDSIKTLK